MSVQQYLEKHLLSRKIEDAVNAAVRAKTPDPVIFIVTPSLSLPLRLHLVPEKMQEKLIIRNHSSLIQLRSSFSGQQNLQFIVNDSVFVVVNLQSHHMRKAVPSVITKIKARQILDSRGIPTVEVDLYTNKGMFRASVPSGDTTGM